MQLKKSEWQALYLIQRKNQCNVSWTDITPKNTSARFVESVHVLNQLT